MQQLARLAMLSAGQESSEESRAIPFLLFPLIGGKEGVETESAPNRANCHVPIKSRSWEGKKWFARYVRFLSRALFLILCFMQFGIFGMIYHSVRREMELIAITACIFDSKGMIQRGVLTF